MRFLDSGNAHEWAGTFTADGVFLANAHPEPQSGREAIRTAAEKTSAQLAEQGIQRRHWLGMLEVEEREDGSVEAHTYALIINTVQGGKPEVLLSCSCDDVLVREGDGQLRVKHRQVYRDDLPK
uniref:SsfY4 n=1 Tax=Streptomyces sp. SF2575 TaxID=746675 RepID=D6MSU8_9ACTN|nr:SsfY4 [Streptomyces sp. SF2575]